MHSVPLPNPEKGTNKKKTFFIFFHIIQTTQAKGNITLCVDRRRRPYVCMVQNVLNFIVKTQAKV